MRFAFVPQVLVHGLEFARTNRTYSAGRTIQFGRVRAQQFVRLLLQLVRGRSRVAVIVLNVLAAIRCVEHGSTRLNLQFHIRRILIVGQIDDAHGIVQCDDLHNLTVIATAPGLRLTLAVVRMLGARGRHRANSVRPDLFRHGHKGLFHLDHRLLVRIVDILLLHIDRLLFDIQRHIADDDRLLWVLVGRVKIVRIEWHVHIPMMRHDAIDKLGELLQLRDTVPANDPRPIHFAGDPHVWQALPVHHINVVVVQ